ncbi:MAG: Holliday junction resolvase RuvX [Candidatus Gallimonas sp.]
MEKRIVAFDVGDKRIGVAVSDPFNEYAMPCETYWRRGSRDTDAAALAKIAEERGAGLIVCGLPVNSDGTPSVQTEKTERFIAALREATQIPVVTEDERYTTVEATRDLIQGGVRREKRKNSVDSIAAAYILDGYLSGRKKEKKSMSMKEESNDYEEDNIVELIDEEGNTLRYEHVGTIEYKGEWYCFFTPEEQAEEADEDEGEEVAVFRLVGDEDNETLEIVDDDALLDEVFAEFCNQYENSEDADDAAALEPDEA